MRSKLLPALLSFTFLSAAPALADTRLEKIASFDHQVTGISVSKDKRVFVNFPRWTEDNEISVAEIKDGKLTAYPNEEWNAWRNTKKNKLSAKDHFVCVQSVVVDKQNNLWVVDAAAPGNERIVPGGVKLVKINLASNKVERTIPLDESAAPQGSYMNDARFSADGRMAYLTDSGKGAIVVVDLGSGKARRVLEGSPSVMVEKDVIVHADGKELRRPDGRAPEFHSDGIALSADGQYLYWQALTGKTLYRVPTAALNDAKLTSKDVEAKVEKVSLNGVADGLWINGKDQMFITSPEDNSVKVRNLKDAKAAASVLIKDDQLRWPDTLSEDADGAIYVTASHIQDSPWFKPDADKAVKTELFRITQ